MSRLNTCSVTLAVVGLGLSTSGFSATLPISYSWTSPDGSTIVQSDGAGANTATPVPGSYDYSHTISAAVAAFPLPGSVTGTYPLGFEFYDDYEFTIAAGATANSVTSTISLGSLLGINNLQARLFKLSGTPPLGSPSLPYIGAVPSGTIIQAWGTPFSCGTGCLGEVTILNNVSLSAGTYVLELRGIVSGAVSGSYGGTLNLADFTVIPVPAAVWLFGSAIAGLGWMRRRAG